MRLARRALEDAKAWHERLSRDNNANPEEGKSIPRSPARLARDLEQARADIETVETAIARIEEEARQQAIPPGWIR